MPPKTAVDVSTQNRCEYCTAVRGGHIDTERKGSLVVEKLKRVS